MNKSYTVQQLEQLKEEYLQSLDNESFDEHYASDRIVYEKGASGFVNWLAERDGQPVYKYKVGDYITTAKCLDGVLRGNGVITTRRFVETDTQPCYLINFAGQLHHVEQSDINA